jgi:hypothetical protein
MSPSFPPEILDYIVDQLHDDPIALKACCVTSKSWIHRTQKHLFACVEFSAPPYVGVWKQTFPDPSHSPAYHTRSLSIRGLSLITAADPGAGDWIRAFHNVVHLHLEGLLMDHRVSLVSFHGLSPTLRSLSLRSISPEVSDLICSFPLLEDLALVSTGLWGDTWGTPSTSPKLTGSLRLRSIRGIHSAARLLLDLPGGLHFAKITVKCHTGDVKPTMDLVSRCSDTLESLEVSYYTPGAFSSASTSGQHLTLHTDPGTPVTPLDLSKATKLKDLLFRCGESNVQQVTMALQTVQSKHLQRITIHPRAASVRLSAEPAPQEWQDLDILLVQFWTSHSIRPKIMYDPGKGVNDIRGLAPSLLPELARRGAIDLVALV